MRHAIYSTGWKKFEPAWDLVIRIKQLSQMRPLLETILSPGQQSAPEARLPGPRRWLTHAAEPGPQLWQREYIHV